MGHKGGQQASKLIRERKESEQAPNSLLCFVFTFYFRF
ncbi:MAG TPA: hypothetical protein VK253_08345 [Candidatus Binatia bacterium]|nr:hypothetical protein [Candidatus Binatia bacterium]